MAATVTVVGRRRGRAGGGVVVRVWRWATARDDKRRRRKHQIVTASMPAQGRPPRAPLEPKAAQRGAGESSPSSPISSSHTSSSNSTQCNNIEFNRTANIVRNDQKRLSDIGTQDPLGDWREEPAIDSFPGCRTDGCCLLGLWELIRGRIKKKI